MSSRVLKQRGYIVSPEDQKAIRDAVHLHVEIGLAYIEEAKRQGVSERQLTARDKLRVMLPLLVQSGRMTSEDAQRAQAFADSIPDKDVDAELRRVWDHFGAGTVWTNYKRLVAQAQAPSDQKTALEHALHASSWQEALATLQRAGMTRSKARAALVKAGRKPGS
jgi:hypothetical protein